MRLQLGFVERFEDRATGIGEDNRQLQDVVDRLAVDNRVRARRVIAGHAADGGAIAGGGVGAEEKSQRAQVGVEVILDDARLNTRPALVGVDLQDLVQVFRKIHHHGMPHRLPGQAGAAAAR